MLSPDFLNAVFEFAGALFVARDVQQLLRDRSIRGVYWPVRGFFAAWGAWNLVYYPLIGQPFSFIAGCCLTFVTVLWTLIAFGFRGN